MKTFMPDDLKYVRYLSWPQISGDGACKLYVEKVAEEEGGTFLPKIRIVDEKGDRVLLDNEYQDQQPLFIDTDQILYLSNESGEYQVWYLNLKTGEKRQITSLRHGVNRYSFSSVTGRIVFEATLWPEDLEKNQAMTPMTRQEKKEWEEELDMRPYEITTLMYKMDEWYGMRHGEYPRIGIINMDGTGARMLPLDFEAEYPAVSHNGKLAAFFGYPHSGCFERSCELYLYDLEKDELTKLTEKMPVSSGQIPIFTPNDASILYLGYSYKERSAVSVPYEIQIADRSSRIVFDVDDAAFVCHGVHPLVAGRCENGENRSSMVLSKDGKTLTFVSACRGKDNLYRVAMDGSSPVEMILAGHSDIQSFAMDEQGEILYVNGDFYTPGELFFQGEKLTDRNAWIRDYELAKVEECLFTSKDGKATIQYYLVHPLHEEEGKQYPAVLDIKGGPQTMYPACFWHEFQALAALDMAVVCANIRGSSGFERSFFAGSLCWDQEAVDDLIGAVEAAAEHVSIDLKKVGVTGGSYGGYMTNKLISQTDFFAAAVTQRSLFNTSTSYGTGDQGFVNGGRGMKEDFTMLGFLENRARTTLMRNIDNIDVPVLVLHAMRDYRCGFEQGEQMFAGMKDRNPDVPCKMVAFPEENHALTRTGKLHSQIRHLSEMCSWFDQYLNKEVFHREKKAKAPETMEKESLSTEPEAKTSNKEGKA